jgi:glycerol-3-phosphate cytidylyltransferase-like family protein
LESIKYVDQVVPINKQEDKFRYIQELNIDEFIIGSDYKGYSDIEDIEIQKKDIRERCRDGL